jgi:hypothetical protein
LPADGAASPFVGVDLDEATITSAAGVLVADLDGDGALDVLLPGEHGAELLRGTGTGSFAAAELIGGPAAYGASAADVDGDGDLDLFLAALRGDSAILLNEGGTFRVSDLLPPSTQRGIATRSGAWADIDRDGDLDLFVVNYNRDSDTADDTASAAAALPAEDESDDAGMPPAFSRLYRNDGDRFTDISDQAGLGGIEGYAYAGGFHDLDDDGWPDLYVVFDFGDDRGPNLVFRNTGGHFDAVGDTGADLAGRGMGLGVGDINGDGLPDLLVTDLNAVHLLVSAGDFSWYDAATAMGMTPAPSQAVGWGAELADLDNDADLDAVVAFGELLVQSEDTPPDEPDAVWVREGDRFVDRAADWGLADTGVNMGVAVADLDGNGWLDVVKRDRRGPTRAYLARCGVQSWLEVSLDGAAPNTAAIGARVRVTTASGTQTRWIGSGSTSLASGGPPVAHFGLADADHIASLAVRWPDGHQDVFTDLAARQRVRVSETVN